MPAGSFAGTSLVVNAFVTVTNMFVDRVTDYLKLLKQQKFNSTPLTSGERDHFLTLEKYFKNIRLKLKGRIQLPSLEECAISSFGIIFGLVWDSQDPHTVWPPSGSTIPGQPFVSGSGLSIPAPPAPLLSDSLSILAEAASVDNALLYVADQDDQLDPLLVDLHERIQANSAFLSTCIAKTADSHHRYRELQAAAIDQWNLANDMGATAYDALYATMAHSEELHALQVHHFCLTREYEAYSSQLRKRRRAGHYL